MKVIRRVTLTKVRREIRLAGPERCPQCGYELPPKEAQRQIPDGQKPEPASDPGREK